MKLKLTYSLLLATFVAVLPMLAEASDLDDQFARDVLIIDAGGGTCYRFDIYLAQSDKQMRRGLMFVRKLPERTGMLFIYDDDDLHSMWMKNTYIPLDMVFARRDGSVASVIENAEPLSLTTRAPTEPIAFVLELNAGVAAKYAIGTGSRLIWDASHGSKDSQPK